jgi:predicted metalloprotease with PDZ domain
VLPAINLGHEYLREFAFTFDQAHDRLLFEPGPRLPPQKRYGIRLGSAPDRFDVAGVEPGSPADLAGVLAGDRVIAVNGTPIGELSLEKRSAAMRAPSVTLEIARGDETLSVPMSLEDGK